MPSTLPAHWSATMSEPEARTIRASIDRGTHHVTLPVPNGPAKFTISGQWDDDEYGPNSTIVSLTCRTRKASSYTEHRLTRDASFPLAAGTIQLELKVLASCPGTALRVTVEPTTPPPEKHIPNAAAVHRRAQYRASMRRAARDR